LAAPKFEFDSLIDKIDNQYIYRRPSTKHMCEHVVTYLNRRTSQFRSLLVHKTSVGGHVNPDQFNQKRICERRGLPVDFGRKDSKVHRLKHDSNDNSNNESLISEEETIEGGNFSTSILDIPNELTKDAFIANEDIDFIQPLRVTVIARLLVPRYH